MADQRCKNFNWTVRTEEKARGDGGACFAGAQLAVLMDIRDEMRKLNAVFACHNTLAIPGMLRKIAANTKRKPRAKR